MNLKIREQQVGFSLVEAMVSLVVLSVGMIGIAALYGQGLSAGRTALYRTQAVNLVADMADRIRANRLAGLSYNNVPANNNCEPAGVNCAPALMASHDLFVWNGQIANLLPGAVGTVQVQNGTPPIYTIRIDWQETGLAGLQTHQIQIQVPPI